MRRVALACTGLGYVPRGFERYTRELFDVVRDDIDATLYAAVSQGAGEVAIHVPHRDSLLARLGDERAYRLEVAAFAARLAMRVRRDRIGVVHYSEPYLGNVLAAMRRRLRLDVTLLLTDGLGLTPASASRADLLHVLTPSAFDAARAGGRPATATFEIPYGLHTQRFRSTEEKHECRRELGLPVDTKIVLDVAAINARHKRVDALIDEAVRLPSDWTLVIVGAPEEPALLDHARNVLGARFVHLRLRRDEMPLVYAAADVFAHAAREEGFGLGIVEAMAAGLPVVVHCTDHFAWLVGDPGQLVDVDVPGALASGVASAQADGGRRNIERAESFDWSALAPRYVEMFRTAQAGVRP